jgi:hypothetical protein
MTQGESEAAVVVGTLQTDIFCEGCGYNLYSQVVTRDDRLNLLVCRCPECGRFAAAGQGSTIGRVWLNRFGTSLLVGWVMFLFCGFGLATLFMGIFPYSHLRNFSHWQSDESPNAGTGMRSHYYYAVGSNRRSYDDAAGDDEMRGEWIEMYMTIAAAGILAFLVGIFNAVFFWHLKSNTRMVALVFPLIAFVGASMCWLLDYMSRFLHGWGMTRLGAYLLLESICVMAGVVAGRTIARAILRWFIPPKVRQHLAFLWTVDGKKAPVAI